MAVAVLETDRLRLRPMLLGDAPFILQLVTDPSWLRFIGDRGVKSLEDARGYITKGPMDSYARHGFGLCITETRDMATPIGICGLLKRDSLHDADLGFALLPRFWGQGYAHEACSAVVEHATQALGLSRLLAVTQRDNLKSVKVLKRLAFRLEGTVRLQEGGEELDLFAHGAAPPF